MRFERDYVRSISIVAQSRKFCIFKITLALTFETERSKPESCCFWHHIEFIKVRFCIVLEDTLSNYSLHFTIDLHLNRNKTIQTNSCQLMPTEN